MAKLPSFRRLFRADFKPDDQDLVESLSQTINSGIESLYDALNKKLTVNDNFLGTEAEVIIEVDSNGIPKNTTSFTLDFVGRAKRIVIGKAVNITNSSTYPAGAPFLSFSQIGNNVVINHITGLQANNKYRISVTAYG